MTNLKNYKSKRANEQGGSVMRQLLHTLIGIFFFASLACADSGIISMKMLTASKTI